MRGRQKIQGQEQYIANFLTSSIQGRFRVHQFQIYLQSGNLQYIFIQKVIKVNWKAKYENEYVANFKILQQAFERMNINKPIDVNKLIKCKYQDNLEFLQWMRKYHDQFRKNLNKPYDAISRRNGALILEKENNPEKLISHPNLLIVKECSNILDHSQNPSSNTTYSRNNCKKSQNNLSTSEQAKTISYSYQSSISNLSLEHDFNQLDEAEDNKDYQQPQQFQMDTCIQRLRDERNFYFSKLQNIDQMLDNISDKNPLNAFEIKRYIKTVLYSTQDQILTIQDDGEVTLTDQQQNQIKTTQFEQFEGLEQLKKDILSTDLALKRNDKKQLKKSQKVKYNDQENKPILQPINSKQNEKQQKNQIYITPQSSQLFYDHSLYLDDFSQSSYSDINLQQQQPKQNKTSIIAEQNKKQQDPLNEICINQIIKYNNNISG